MDRTQLVRLLLAVAVLVLLTLSCVEPPELTEWQNDVMEHQRAGLPTDTPEPTR